MRTPRKSTRWLFPLALLGMVTALLCCNRPAPLIKSDDAASKVYVAPGEYDEFYGFFSGGFSGQVSVYGIPSGRLLKIIPVFSQFPENGWGYSEETKPMLQTSYGFVPWDDAHHPSLSRVSGETDGRWLFINGNNTPRIARIDLSTFETAEIIEIPHSAGNHGSPFTTENTEYVVASTRFSVPVPQKDVPISSYKENFGGTMSFVKVNPESGQMSIAFQIRMPAFDFDLARAGKGPSHGWAFFTSYNTEEASTLKEINSSKNDKDYVAAINWKRAEECIADNKGQQVPARYFHNEMDEGSRVAHSEEINSVLQLAPADCEGMVYFLPTPKSPHGIAVDPSGKYIAAGGKLAAVVAVHSYDKMLNAIENKLFDGDRYGIPVLKYEEVLKGEVKEAGLGPLHTEFDGKGFGYSSSFITSEIVKWNLETLQVVDRIPSYYSIGHLMIPGGDTRKPYGKYVIGLNKITKDRYLPTGPELAHSAQLVDISGEKMKLLLDFPTVGEPHYAQAIPADKIAPKSVKMFPIEKNTHPYGIKGENEARVERSGNDVHVYASTIRSHFKPDNIEGVKVGDRVHFHITNLEQDWDVPHGFAVIGAPTSELLIMPGETRTIIWEPQNEGVYPYYCTDFCSALHQEMQGYIRVSPADSDVNLAFGTGGN